MGSLLIRDVDPVLHRRLKESARSHRRSLEDEARELLREAVAQRGGGQKGASLGQIAQRCFGPEHGVDLELPARDQLPARDPVDLDTHATES